LEKILSTSEVGPILALIAPSPLTCLLQAKKCGIRAQYCGGLGDQNVNLVASVTTSLIEVGDWKFWIIFHQREKNIELED
jgi:hypothetical protein